MTSTYKYGLIGNPLGHSVSPFVHEKLLALAGLKGEYKLYPTVSACDFPHDLDGFSVTIPHKSAIIPLLTEVDESATIFGAVNCVKRASDEDGTFTWKGFNTDCYGFRKTAQIAGANLGGRVLLLGSGGAARAAAFETAFNGGHLTICVRSSAKSKESGERLAAELNRLTILDQSNPVRVTTYNNLRWRYDVVINATPCGMFPNVAEMPVSENFLCFENVGCVIDLIYNPHETLLMKTAAKQCIKTIGGIAMLVFQAAEAQRIWNGAVFDDEDLYKLCGEVETLLTTYAVDAVDVADVAEN